MTKIIKSQNTDTPRKCNSCCQPIDHSAKVCQHCGRSQNRYMKLLQTTPLLIPLLLAILAGLELYQARQKNIDASKALNIANATVEQVRSIACITAKAILTNSMAANFMGGTTLKTGLDQNERIINTLIEIGASEEKIKDAKKMWSKGIGVIYHRGIHNALEGRTDPHMLNMKASPELRAASKEFDEMLNFSEWEVPSPDKMESFIEGKGFMNDTVRELISDYRHFLETGNIRRRSVFEQL